MFMGRIDRQTGSIRESTSLGRNLTNEVWTPGTSLSVLYMVSWGPQPFGTLGTYCSHQLFTSANGGLLPSLDHLLVLLPLHQQLGLHLISVLQFWDHN